MNQGAKPLFIVQCLDITRSMLNENGEGKSKMELMNEAIVTFFKESTRSSKIRSAAKIAFVLFDNQIRCKTEFIPITKLEQEDFPADAQVELVEYKMEDKSNPRAAVNISMNIPQFSVPNETATKMGKAVQCAVDMLVEARKKNVDKGIECYTPILMVATDGNPDKEYDQAEIEKAIQMVNDHCDRSKDKDGIIPFIIGIGDQLVGTSGEEKLKRFSAGFPEGYFAIPDSDAQLSFKEVFKVISDSLARSIEQNGYHNSDEEIDQLDEQPDAVTCKQPPVLREVGRNLRERAAVMKKKLRKMAAVDEAKNSEE